MCSPSRTVLFESWVCHHGLFQQTLSFDQIPTSKQNRLCQQKRRSDIWVTPSRQLALSSGIPFLINEALLTDFHSAPACLY